MDDCCASIRGQTEKDFWWLCSCAGIKFRTKALVFTLTGLTGVFVQLGNLPVQVGVPGLQLEVVQWLNMEVWTFDLQVIAEHALTLWSNQMKDVFDSFQCSLQFFQALCGLFKGGMIQENNLKQRLLIKHLK